MPAEDETRDGKASGEEWKGLALHNMPSKIAGWAMSRQEFDGTFQMTDMPLPQ